MVPISFETFILLIELEVMEVYKLRPCVSEGFPAIIWEDGEFREFPFFCQEETE